MKKWLSSYTITPTAIVLLPIFIVAAVLAFVAAQPINYIGFIVAVIVLSAPVLGRMSGGRGLALKTLRERQEEFPAKRRNQGEDGADPSVERDDWARERQRYRERQ